jgi:hypothetical protein
MWIRRAGDYFSVTGGDFSVEAGVESDVPHEQF